MINKIKFLLMLISFTSVSQNFEGEIIYSNSYTSNTAQIKDDQWRFMLGTIQKYFIKDGSYKSETNGKLLLWQLYDNKENKLYNKMSNSDIVYWNNGSVQGDEILDVKVNKNVEEILGYRCDEIIFTCKSGIQKYYYNSGQLLVDPPLPEVFHITSCANVSDFAQFF
ncbi:hypothetical protein [Flavobacterium ustbae]|uniref:hypothetical protein n=1 Tax=Flavobacterium ustbae TaxID=2488790 RepID=UPI000F7AB0F4|nr:hypothetical protein [Flavobacterium ustbae]